MIDIAIGQLTFTFPDSWHVSQYDEWAFYRKQFCKMWDGIKAVDLLALEDRVLWMIEVKDYRTSRRTKVQTLPDEVAHKVFATLASMLPAKVHASSMDEQNFAARVLQGQALHVVLHLEQPVKHSKLFPRAIDPLDVQQKLRSLIKPIDPHPKVVESVQMQGLAWMVR